MSQEHKLVFDEGLGYLAFYQDGDGKKDYAFRAQPGRDTTGVELVALGERIVKRFNAHEELVTALENTLDQLEQWYQTECVNGKRIEPDTLRALKTGKEVLKIAGEI